ncbi:MAG TPA: 2-hydroxychromene-2-carboxylate isomerase [Burkholderiaceae bacterium]|nr:2-hydroxychromene-2-carboxylate isomerase [Burkholderiaceae bacterium]
MKQIGFWFDPISPFAYLAFERLPEALEGCTYAVEYRPLLFAGLLAQWGQKGPAEIEPKRQWTFRHVAWMAHQWGIPLQTPATHPFNPLPLLRLVVAAGANRRTVEPVMRHVWRSGGAEALDAARLDALARELKPARDPASVEVKAELRAATDAAIARGLFGVPTFELDGRLFWGVDALPMLRAALLGDPWFDGPAWDAAGAPRPGVRR